MRSPHFPGGARDPRARWLALLALLAFLAPGVGHGLGLHACPHHDAMGGPGGSAGIHAGHAASSAHPEVPAEDSAPEGPCTCIGDCHPGGVTPLPVVAASIASVVGVEVRVALPARAGATPRSHPPYFLPYATAPPPRLFA